MVVLMVPQKVDKMDVKLDKMMVDRMVEKLDENLVLVTVVLLVAWKA